jgi:hypothetical protein
MKEAIAVPEEERLTLESDVDMGLSQDLSTESRSAREDSLDVVTSPPTVSSSIGNASSTELEGTARYSGNSFSRAYKFLRNQKKSKKTHSTGLDADADYLDIDLPLRTPTLSVARSPLLLDNAASAARRRTLSSSVAQMESSLLPSLVESIPSVTSPPILSSPSWQSPLVAPGRFVTPKRVASPSLSPPTPSLPSQPIHPSPLLGSESLGSKRETFNSGLITVYDDHRTLEETLVSDPASFDPNVDFVAVHGLGGDPFLTFTDRSTGCCWIRDLLPQTFPACRVFTFAPKPPETRYDPSYLCEALWDELYRRGDERVRGIIFVGHSVGGLLVKKALLEASRTKRLRGLFDRTIGVMFFGTPQGTNHGDPFKTLRLVSSTLPVYRDLMKALELDAKTLQKDNAKFLQLVKRTELFCLTYYETLNTLTIPRLGSALVVSHEMATLDIPNEERVALQANHSDLCKFAGPSDANYKRVIGTLGRNLSRNSDDNTERFRRRVDSASAIASATPWSPNLICKIGGTATGLFDMTGSAEEPPDPASTEFDIIMVHGLGGSPWRSWIDTRTEALWMRDFLPGDFPAARIMSYGYRYGTAKVDRYPSLAILAADLTSNIMDARRMFDHDHRRALILVGYDLGGLLVKQVSSSTLTSLLGR